MERALPPRGAWSTITEAVKLSISSTLGFLYLGSSSKNNNFIFGNFKRYIF